MSHQDKKTTLSFNYCFLEHPKLIFIKLSNLSEEDPGLIPSRSCSRQAEPAGRAESELVQRQPSRGTTAREPCLGPTPLPYAELTDAFLLTEPKLPALNTVPRPRMAAEAPLTRMHAQMRY